MANKEELLDGMVDVVVGEIRKTPPAGPEVHPIDRDDNQALNEPWSDPAY